MINEMPELCSENSTFEVNGQKYIRKNQNVPQFFELFFISEFQVFFNEIVSNFYQKNDNKFLNPATYLDSSLIAHTFNFYALYFFSENGSEEEVLQKSIHLEEISHVVWASFHEDFLPGFNFYIQTKRKLILLSTKTASEAVFFVQGLKLSLHFFKKLKKRGLLYSFQNAKVLLAEFESFKLSNFCILVKKDYELSKDEFNFDNVIQSFQNFKKYLRLLKINKIGAQIVSEFVGNYHQTFSHFIKHFLEKLGSEEFMKLRKHMFNYNEVLQKYLVIDESFNLLLLHLEMNLNSKILDKVTKAAITKIDAYFDNSKKQNDYNKNFYLMIFQTLLGELDDFDKKTQINTDLLENLFKNCNRHICSILFTKKDVSFIQLIHLLNSSCKFNREFFDFIDKHKETIIDPMFIQKLERSAFSEINNRQLNVYYKQIHRCLEEKVYFFFIENSVFEFLDPLNLLTKNLYEIILKVKKNLLGNLAEMIINNILNTFLKFYFLSLLSSFYLSANELHYEKKLERDKTAISKFFQSFLEPENLNAQIETFNQFYALLTESNSDRLLQAIIKFDLFMNNKLQAETVSAVFEKNINVSIEVENDIMSFFSEKIQKKEKSFQLNRSSFNASINMSKNQKITRTVSNYLPYVSLRIFLKVKIHAFESKARVISKGLKEALDLSFENEFAPQKNNEKILENFVKVLILDSEEFDLFHFHQKLCVF